MSRIGTMMLLTWLSSSLAVRADYYRTDEEVKIIDLQGAGHPAWSPDGRFLAFSAAPEGTTDIYLLEIATGAVTQLTNMPGLDNNPTWSPDGSEIAFISNRTGPWRLHVMSRDGSNPREILGGDQRTNDFDPDWSPVGDEIALVSKRLGESGIISVDLRSGEWHRWSDDSLDLNYPRCWTLANS